MILKQAIISDRIRKINGTFAWIGPRFLRQGFWNLLTHHELILSLFLLLVGDRCGLSYYNFDKICTLLSILAQRLQAKPLIFNFFQESSWLLEPIAGIEQAVVNLKKALSTQEVPPVDF